jgi:hypothetical protein
MTGPEHYLTHRARSGHVAMESGGHRRAIPGPQKRRVESFGSGPTACLKPLHVSG